MVSSVAAEGPTGVVPEKETGGHVSARHIEELGREWSAAPRGDERRSEIEALLTRVVVDAPDPEAREAAAGVLIDVIEFNPYSVDDVGPDRRLHKKLVWTTAAGQRYLSFIFEGTPDREGTPGVGVEIVRRGLRADVLDTRRPALDFLKRSVDLVPEELLSAVIDAVKAVDEEDPAGGTGDIRELKGVVLRRLEESGEFAKNQIELARGSDDETRAEAIEWLTDHANPRRTREVVNRWTGWIAGDESAALIGPVATRIIKTPDAVQPLTEVLKVTEKDGWNPIVTGGTRLDQWAEQRIRATENWRQRLRLTGYRAADRAEHDRAHHEQVQRLVDERRMSTRRQVAALLAEMSKEAHGGTLYDPPTAEKVQDALHLHAVPVAARQISSEPDVDVRESLARVLAWEGGRESISALVAAVAAGERTRKERSDLLSEYYLKPSRQRSEDAATILKGAVKDARKTLHTLRWLNILFFFVALGLLVWGFYMLVTGDDQVTKVLGGASGLAGFVGVIMNVIREPLDRIQNALGNLVQVEAAFTSFIWELNLNGTYIQSQYVAEGKLDDLEIERTSERIEQALQHAIQLIAAYTIQGRQRIVSRIHSIAPAAASPGTEITVSGQSLLGDRTAKVPRTKLPGNRIRNNGHTGLVAIDHKPIELPAASVEWHDNEVTFELPASLKSDASSGLLVSLFVDGMETNALPLTLVNPAQAA